MRCGFCLGQNNERQCSFCRTGRHGAVRGFHRPAHHSRAGRLCARPGLCADPLDRAAFVDHDARAGDLQRLQFVHPARGAVLPPDRQPDEHRRHHRPPGGVVALDGRALAGIVGADQCRAVGVLCRYLRPPPADAASQSKIFIDAQTKEGYDLSFSIAITAVSAVLAVIIPPSILMVVWGGVISTSIGALYLAGIIPGLLIAGAQMATVHVYAVRRKYPVYPRATFKEFFRSVFDSVPALLTPFIIVGGILLGWFTPTESAAVAVIYAALLSMVVYREMGRRQLYTAILETGRLSAIAL